MKELNEPVLPIGHCVAELPESSWGASDRRPGKAAQKAPHSKRCRDRRAAANFAQRLECGDFSTAFESRGRAKEGCRWVFLATILAAAVLLAGCHTEKRSISNSGYQAPPKGYSSAPPADPADSAFAYRGELSEFDVLGVTRGTAASDTEIEQALASAKRVRLRAGNSILLIQSGAIFPDGPMVAELGKHFRIVPFTGVPPASRVGDNGPFERGDAESFSRSLRLAAARGGNEMMLCYWGVLETENAKLAGKTISWVPVVKWAVPDEREHMRIRLKLALVDVRTGDWAVLSPEPVDDSRVSRSPRREVADQKLVESLKQRAYETAAKELLRQYSDIAAAN